MGDENKQQNQPMTRDELEDILLDLGAEGAIMLDGYEDAAIGITSDGGVVYSYWKMVQVLCRDDDMTEEEAMEWIDYNTIRSLGYMPEEQRPVIITCFDDIGLI